MLRTLQQNKQLHTLLAKLKITPEQKIELVMSFTNNRTYRSSEMEVSECESLIRKLQQMDNTPRPVVRVNPFVGDHCDKMRKKCLSIAHELRWEHPDGSINMAIFNAWCLNFSFLKKPFNLYTATELPKLISQLEMILSKEYARK
jgi:hypothetical protein